MKEGDVLRDAERIKALASLAEVIRDFYTALVNAGFDVNTAAKLTAVFFVELGRQ